MGTSSCRTPIATSCPTCIRSGGASSKLDRARRNTSFSLVTHSSRSYCAPREALTELSGLDGIRTIVLAKKT
jgi:hypothetical protein